MLTALLLVAAMHGNARVPPGHHYGWQHLGNPHRITVTVPPPPNWPRTPKPPETSPCVPWHLGCPFTG
jgi:hypothetical protein